MQEAGAAAPRFQIAGSRWVAVGHPRVSMPLDRLVGLRGLSAGQAGEATWQWARNGWVIRWPALSYEISERRLASLVTRWMLLDQSRRRQRPGSGSLPYGKMERKAPNMDAHLHGLLGHAPAPFALCGGMAVNYYTAPRFTDDVDLVVLTADAAQWEAFLLASGFTRHEPLSVGGWAYQRGPWEVDVLVTEAAWAPAAVRDAQNNLRDGLPVLPLPWLVYMKLEAGRTVDGADVSRLVGVLPRSQFDDLVRVLDSWLTPEDREDLEAWYALGRWEWGES